MVQKRLLKVSSLILAWILFGAVMVQAASINVDLVAEDFQPVKGVLVMPLEGQWLIDVDAAAGVIPGDLFAVVETGRPVLHPATNEIIGHIEKIKSVLKITRIKTGYSYAELHKQDGELKPGQEVRRFTGLPAQMQDATGDGRVLYAELQAALPQLEWQGYSAFAAGSANNETNGLLFRLDQKGLTVAGYDGTPLRFYPSQGQLAANQQLPAGVISRSASLSSGAIVAAAPAQTNLASGGIVRTEAASQDGIWRSPNFRTGAVGVTVADLDGDEQLEVAVLTDSSVEVVRLSEGNYHQIAHYDLPNTLEPLGLDSADLDGNGKSELYLTAARKHNLDSMVLELAGKSLTEVAKALPYYFRKTMLDGEGDILLGQRFGNYERAFVGQVFRVQRRGDEIEPGAVLSLPRNTTVFSFVSIGNGMVARINQQALSVSGPAGDIWTGDAVNGASEIYIDFEDPNATSPGEDTMPYFLAPRLADGGNGVVLATEHKGGLLSHKMQSFSQGRVVALQWDGNSMQELWHTRPQSGYLADFNFADADNDGEKEIVGFFTFGREGLMSLSSGRSALMLFDLN